jgi:3-hydroxymyristoyl/3-hydroxydecanoyl-(acyl carrier protein) dehydratase
MFVPDARLFEGHFDGAPILPGVAQIALAVDACVGEGLQTGPLSGVQDVRFARPLGPSDAIAITLAPGREAGTVKFEIRSADQVATTGVLIFGA